MTLTLDPRPRIHLPDVTLVCIDTRTPAQSLYALRRSLTQVDFGLAVLISTQPTQDLHRQAAEAGIEWRTISPLRNIGEYSRFILHELVHHVDTSHALVVQWDGFVTHPHLWTNAFLEYDYIGSPWFEAGKIHSVGNGGFSLRSRRLLRASADLPYDGHSPEDWVICISQRAHLEGAHQLHIAPIELARRFGVEQGPHVEAFGFHGVEHFAHEMTEAELSAWLADAPTSLLGHRHTRKLVKALAATGRWQLALKVNQLRANAAGWDIDAVLLHMRAWLGRFRASSPHLKS